MTKRYSLFKCNCSLMVFCESKAHPEILTKITNKYELYYDSKD